MDRTIFRFGGFELDSAQRELRCSGDRVDLQPRVFDLLLYLVTHREKAIGKEELQDAVWPGTIVTEAALTRAVMKARKAVGDDASSQAVIRTVHGHGYHFVAKVDVITSREPIPEAPTESTENRKKIRWPVLLIALLILTAGLFGLWQATRPPQTAPDLRIAVLPLIDRTGDPELAWSRLGLMSFTSKALAAEGSIPVVADGSVAGLSSSLGWDDEISGLAESDLAKRLHRIYGATHIVAMELLAEGPMLRMNYALADSQGHSQKGTMVGRDGVQLANGVVQAVYGLLLGRSRLRQDETLVSEDPFNNEAFARGMHLVLEGRCPEAVQFFRVIVEQEPELFTPRLELASCLRIMGEPGEAEIILLQLVEEQTVQQNSAALGQSLMVLGILQNRTGRLDEAESSYTSALDAAIAAGDADLEARTNHNLAILAKNRGDWTESAAYLDKAAAGYQQAGREIMPGQLWSGYANLKMGQGKLVEAEEYLEKALDAFRETGDRRNEAMMLNNYGYLLRMQGRLDEAESFHLQSLAIREEIRDRVGVGRIYSMLSGLYTARGDYKKARNSAEAALGIARETRDRLFEGTSLAQLANAERALSLPDAARGHYRESRDVLLSIQDEMRVLQVELKLAEMELEEGFPEAAEAISAASLETAREGDFIEPEIEALVLLGDIALAQGKTLIASEHYGKALDRVRDSNLEVKERSVLVKLAEVQMDMGKTAETRQLIGALIRLEPSVSSLRTRARHASLTGDPETAADNMTAARELAGENWSSEDEVLLQSYRDAR